MLRDWLFGGDPVGRFVSRHASGVALDIGAHHGEYLERMSSRCSRVFAFEPDPRNFEVLSRKSYRNVVFVNKAVSERSGRMTFFLDAREDSTGLSSSAEKLNIPQSTMEVECVSVDDFCRELSPSFIKIDVEGHEPAVIRGARHTISRNLPALILEMWETWRPLYRDCLEFLSSAGYELKELPQGDGVVNICAIHRRAPPR